MTHSDCDFIEAKIRITYLESLVSRSKPLSQWVGPAQPPLLMWCCCSVLCSDFLRGCLGGNIYCSIHLAINTCPLCTSGPVVFITMKQCYPCSHSKQSNKILFFGSKDWNSWKFWIQLWIISMRRKRGDLWLYRLCANSACLMDLRSAWQEERQNEYKKENHGKIVEESKRPAGAHFGGGGGEEKNPQNRRIGLGLKKERSTGKVCCCRKINVIVRDNREKAELCGSDLVIIFSGN